MAHRAAQRAALGHGTDLGVTCKTVTAAAPRWPSFGSRTVGCMRAQSRLSRALLPGSGDLRIPAVWTRPWPSPGEQRGGRAGRYGGRLRYLLVRVVAVAPHRMVLDHGPGERLAGRDKAGGRLLVGTILGAGGVVERHREAGHVGRSAGVVGQGDLLARTSVLPIRGNLCCP